MYLLRVLTASLLLLSMINPVAARAPEKSWDNRCEQCHGDYAEFSGKYLWVIDGQLQGQHHIDDLQLFLEKHYIPAHEVDGVRDMLASAANSPLRFETECGSCHGEVTEFVASSIWVRGDEITAMGVSMEAGEYLKTHQGINAEDIAFYLKLFRRMQ